MSAQVQTKEAFVSPSGLTEEMLPPPHKSWNMVLGELNEAQRDAILESLNDDEAISACGDWFFSARREQMPPIWNWFIWLIMAGRGFGKTWTGSHWLVNEHVEGRAKNSGIVAATSSDLRKYCLEGSSGILSLAPNSFRPIHQPSNTRLVWPDGAITLLFTSEEPERLRGPNLDKAWCDELAAWRRLEDTWTMLQMCMRLGSQPQLVVTTTPRPKATLRNLLDRRDVDVAVTAGSTHDNVQNLAGRFVQEVIAQYSGTKLERQEIYGELLDEFEGALWNYSILDRFRVPEVPNTTRLVVAVDPAISSDEGADLTGIVVAALGENKHGYILGDHSLRASPERWATKVVGLYNEFKASLVVAEKNQGGEMVEATIHAIDKDVNVSLVHASKAKVTRAEPIAAFYEQGRVHHVGTHKDLEDQMCLFLPGEIKKSPDRVDALVWGLTELMANANQTAPRLRSL